MLLFIIIPYHTISQLRFELGPGKRKLTVPDRFGSAREYQHTIIAMLYGKSVSEVLLLVSFLFLILSPCSEHLNVSLAVIKARYREVMATIVTTGGQSRDQSVSCPHGPGKLHTVSKEGPNKGRGFYCCPQSELIMFDFNFVRSNLRFTSMISTLKSLPSSVEMCNLFKWSTTPGGPALAPSSTPRQVYDTISRRGLSVYRECRVKKKSNSNLYLVNLPFTDKHHNYNKDDVWILNPGREGGVT